MKKWHWYILGVLFLITLILEFTVLADYEGHWWNEIPAFYALFGFVSCVAIIFFAKFLAKKIVNRDPEYYDR
ncbi:MAG: hypothetical protein ACFCU6_07975 [Balneolaceae bacterium]